MPQIIYNDNPIKLTSIGEILTLAPNIIDISNNDYHSSLLVGGLTTTSLVERADYAPESIVFYDISGGSSVRNSIVVNGVNNLEMGAIQPSAIIDSLNVSGSANQVLVKNVNNDLEWLDNNFSNALYDINMNNHNITNVSAINVSTLNVKNQIQCTYDVLPNFNSKSIGYQYYPGWSDQVSLGINPTLLSSINLSKGVFILEFNTSSDKITNTYSPVDPLPANITLSITSTTNIDPICTCIVSSYYVTNHLTRIVSINNNTIWNLYGLYSSATSLNNISVTTYTTVTRIA